MLCDVLNGEALVVFAERETWERVRVRSTLKFV
jgi:hypothetical protein